jgi:rhodanese-related sulfurtransferase
MEIPLKKVAAWVKEKKDFHFLDVRTDEERAIASLGGIHIPLDQLKMRAGELPRDKKPIIIYCHHGVRSLHAAQFLKFEGYDALSMQGGIDLWSIEVDPNVPRY